MQVQPAKWLFCFWSNRVNTKREYKKGFSRVNLRLILYHRLPMNIFEDTNPRALKDLLGEVHSLGCKRPMILCITFLHQFILVLSRNCCSSQGGATYRRLAYLQPFGDGYRCHPELSMRPKT